MLTYILPSWVAMVLKWNSPVVSSVLKPLYVFFKRTAKAFPLTIFYTFIFCPYLSYFHLSLSHFILQLHIHYTLRIILMYYYYPYYSVFWDNIVTIHTTVKTGLSPFVFFVCIRHLPDDG